MQLWHTSAPTHFRWGPLSWTPGAGSLLVFQSPLEPLLLGDPMLPLLAILLAANPLVSCQSEETAVPGGVWEGHRGGLFPIDAHSPLVSSMSICQGPLNPHPQTLSWEELCARLQFSLPREGSILRSLCFRCPSPSPTSESFMSVSSVHSKSREQANWSLASGSLCAIGHTGNSQERMENTYSSTVSCMYITHSGHTIVSESNSK